MKPRFIVDVNVGRLARKLRMLGYDTWFINGLDDNELIRIAFREERILLTKDSGIMRRNIVTSGKVKAILITDDRIDEQLRHVVETLGLNTSKDVFSRCLECNTTLISRKKDEVSGLVPPYVFQTQERYMECPDCHRIYWQGTHWGKMNQELRDLTEGRAGSNPPPICRSEST